MAGPGFAPPPPPPSSSKGGSKGGKKGPAHPGSVGGKDYYATYLSIIQGLGIGVTKDAIAFAHHANTQHWSEGEFMYYLRQTAFYHQTFPGITGPNNTLRMSEAQYNSNFRSLSDKAGQIGVGFTKQMYGFALGKGLKEGTILGRMTAWQRIQESPVVFRQFEQTLQARGLAPKGGLKSGDLPDFVLGMADPRWYHVWQEASLRSGAAEAGLRIGSDITRRELLRIGASLPGFQSETDLAKPFAELAQNIRSAIPLSRLARLGVTNHDLEVLEFGGAHRLGFTREQVAARLASVYATVKAQTQGPAAMPDIAETQQGAQIRGLAGLSAPPAQTL